MSLDFQSYRKNKKNKMVTLFLLALPDAWFTFGSKKLKFFHERKTWGRARKHCQSIGGELVSINSEDKNEFITHLIDRLITNATTG